MGKASYFLWLLLLSLLALGLYQDVKFAYESRLWMPKTPEIREVQGVVTGLPLILLHRETLTLQTSDGPLRISQFGDSERLTPGESIQLQVKVMPRTWIQHPGQFNTSEWLKASGWMGEAEVIAPPWPHRVSIPNPMAHVMGLTGQVRFALLQKLTPLFASLSEKGYLLALVLGDRSELTAEDWWMFQSTGTNHLVAIAGLHIGFLMLMAFLMLTGISRVIGGCFVKRPCLQGMCRWGAFGFGAFYAMLSGFSLPAERALWMALIGLIAWQMRRLVSLWMLYSLALVSVILVNPWSLEGASFWLSFGAVACLIYSLSGRLGNHPVLEHYWHPQWVMFVGLWPLTLFFFHQISFVGFMANLIVVPLTLLIIMPLLLLGLLFLFLPWKGLDVLIWKIANGVLAWQVKFLLMLAHLPDAIVPMPQVPIWKIVLLCVGAMIFLMPKAFKLRGLSALMVLPLVFPHVPVSEGHLKITTLHARKMQAILIQTHHHTLLIDQGGRGPWVSLQTFTLIPWLRAEGVSQVNLWIEARPLASAQAPDKIWQRYLNMPVHSVVPTSSCPLGAPWVWDGVKFLWIQGAQGSLCRLGVEDLKDSNTVTFRSFVISHTTAHSRRMGDSRGG